MKIVKKKRRRRLNNKGKAAILSLTILTAGIFCLPGYLRNKELKELGYSKDTIKLIEEQDLSSFIRKGDYYSKTLETAIRAGRFEKDYINYYLKMDNLTADHKMMINKLGQKGYSEDEIIKLFDKKEVSALYPLTVYDKIGDLDSYLQHGVDKSDNSLLNPYENMKIVAEWKLDMLVSKKSQIAESLETPGLRTVNKYCAFRETVLADEAATAFEKMCEQGKADGVYFASVYGYRSYADQKEIYDSYAADGGTISADEIAAQPGSSEHQVGLAVDIASMMKTEDQEFVDTAEYKWLQENAYKYGFIERYTASNQGITGYDAEPWHWRYIGADLATKVVESGLSYDEYYELYIR